MNESILASVSLPILAMIYKESNLLSKYLDTAPVLNALAQKYYVKETESFQTLIEEVGRPNLESLQLQYAETDSLSHYKDIVAKGANNWLDSAVIAGANSPEITDYLFWLFTHERRSYLLAGYATRRFDDNEALEDYLIEVYKEPSPIDVFEAIAVGAVFADNLALIRKCISYGAKNIPEIATTAIITGSMNVFKEFYCEVDRDLVQKTAIQYNNTAVIIFLLEQGIKPDSSSSPELHALYQQFS
jgi:hypothetical protein